jgi:hypothetical protein
VATDFLDALKRLTKLLRIVPVHLLQGNVADMGGTALAGLPIFVICGLIAAVLISIELGYRP